MGYKPGKHDAVFGAGAAKAMINTAGETVTGFAGSANLTDLTDPTDLADRADLYGLVCPL